MNDTAAFNDSNNVSTTSSAELRSAPVFITLCMSSIGIWTTVVNGAVIVFLWRARKTVVSAVSFTILSLSFTDFIVGLSIFPLLMTFTFPKAFLSYRSCATIFSIYVVSQGASFYHVLVICVQRVIAASQKTPSRQDFKNNLILILFTWAFALVVAPVPFIYMEKNLNRRLSVCSFEELFQGRYNMSVTYIGAFIMFSQVMTNLAYIYLYVKLVRRSRRVNREIPRSLAPSKVVASDTAPKYDDREECASKTVPNKEFSADFNDSSKSFSRSESLPCLKINEYSPMFKAKKRQSHPGIFSGFEIFTVYNPSPQNGMHNQGKAIVLKENRSADGCVNKEKASLEPTDTSVERRQILRKTKATLAVGHKRTLITIGYVLLLCNLFMSPYAIALVYERACTCSISKPAKFMVAFCSLFNSALNPIVYIFRVPAIRRSVMSLLHQRRFFRCNH